MKLARISFLALVVCVAGVASEIEGSTPWLEVPIAFLDVETTGRDPQKDRVIELGIVVGTFGSLDNLQRHGWMINPGVPVSAESSAVHGITDADLVGKPTFASAVPTIIIDDPWPAPLKTPALPSRRPVGSHQSTMSRMNFGDEASDGRVARTSRAT